MTAEQAHAWSVRVYYEDTDFSGVVYHASYLRFLERGRTEALRTAGVDQAVLFEAGQAFAVRSMTLEFLAAARMDDLLVVTTAVERIGGASVAMRQAVCRDRTLLVTAAVRLALVAGGRTIRLPPPLIAALRVVGSNPSGVSEDLTLRRA